MRRENENPDKQPGCHQSWHPLDRHLGLRLFSGRIKGESSDDVDALVRHQVNVPVEENVSQLRLPLLFSSKPDMKGGRPKRQQRRVDYNENAVRFSTETWTVQLGQTTPHKFYLCNNTICRGLPFNESVLLLSFHLSLFEGNDKFSPNM